MNEYPAGRPKPRNRAAEVSNRAPESGRRKKQPPPDPEIRLVFGPVPTRRLGRSLGIDTVPLKTCNWNCVYCQLGRTRRLVAQQSSFYRVPVILAQVEKRLQSLPGDAVDWITFVGSGEGTLHEGIGDLILGVKRLSRHPVAVITNGSLLDREEVRDALAAADAVLPSLDAGSEELFRRMNRPHPSLTFARQVAGLEAFARRRDRGKVWVEVMLVAGLNDSRKALDQLAGVLGRVNPDEVHLVLPSRCPAAAGVHPPSHDRIEEACVILGASVKTVSPPVLTSLPADPLGLEEEILSILIRHPMHRDDLPRLFGSQPAESVGRAIDQLLADGRVQMVDRHATSFVAPAGGRYEDPG